MKCIFICFCSLLMLTVNLQAEINDDQKNQTTQIQDTKPTSTEAQKNQPPLLLMKPTSFVEVKLKI